MITTFNSPPSSIKSKLVWPNAGEMNKQTNCTGNRSAHCTMHTMHTMHYAQAVLENGSAKFESHQRSQKSLWHRATKGLAGSVGNGLVKIGSLKISMINIQWQWKMAKILPDLKSDQTDLTRNQSLHPRARWQMVEPSLSRKKSPRRSLSAFLAPDPGQLRRFSRSKLRRFFSHPLLEDLALA